MGDTQSREQERQSRQQNCVSPSMVEQQNRYLQMTDQERACLQKSFANYYYCMGTIGRNAHSVSVKCDEEQQIMYRRCMHGVYYK